MLVLLLAASVTTMAEGAPTRLPSSALGSTVLLHGVRAGALFAIGLAVATVLAQASAGRLPTQVSTAGITYDPIELVGASTAELQGELDGLKSAMSDMADRLDALESNP